MKTVFHSLVLNLHQPAGNLEHLLDHNPWEAREILFALDRIPRFLWPYEDVARVQLSFSGTLLETLSSPDFQQRVYGIVDCGSMLWHYQNRKLFDILGSGYYHPLLPLTPAADREEQLRRWRGIAEHLFWRRDFNGFWPPEMGFSMELIPLLRRMGYRYVLVDSEHVEAVTPMSWERLRYRPHIARYGDDEIIVVVRDRDLSNAQESGMEYDWFRKELQARTRWCDFPPLVTTATDGENGGWFRNHDNTGNFWGAFYRELLLDARAGGSVQPFFIDDYLQRFGAEGEVHVHAGAWNTGWHDGRDFVQWTGSQTQKDAWSRLHDVSGALREAAPTANGTWQEECLQDALWRLLRAETSCNFYWGEAWVQRAHDDLDEALCRMAQN